MVRVSLFLTMVVALALFASAESVWDLVTSSPRPKKSSRKVSVIESGYEKPKTVEKPMEGIVEVPVEKIVEVPVTSVVERVVTVEKPVERVVEVPVTNVVERIVERKVFIERTNVVEKVVYDRSLEMKLAKEKSEVERRGEALEARSAGLEKRIDELTQELSAERHRRERLERELPKEAKARAEKTGRPARITSTETRYDRKRGVVFFNGNVHVDDENYQMHADKAYVFAEGTNDMRRIVAIGNVALTNGTRRAYGGKISYYRQDGMVVLYADGGVPAEVRDESKAEDQTMRGSKIKFWIGSGQIEILDATISTPTDGVDVGIRDLR